MDHSGNPHPLMSFRFPPPYGRPPLKCCTRGNGLICAPGEPVASFIAGHEGISGPRRRCYCEGDASRATPRVVARRAAALDDGHDRGGQSPPPDGDLRRAATFPLRPEHPPPGLETVRRQQDAGIGPERHPERRGVAAAGRGAGDVAVVPPDGPLRHGGLLASGGAVRLHLGPRAGRRRRWPAGTGAVRIRSRTSSLTASW